MRSNQAALLTTAVMFAAASAAGCAASPAGDAAGSSSSAAAAADTSRHSSATKRCAVTSPMRSSRYPHALATLHEGDLFGAGDLWVNVWANVASGQQRGVAVSGDGRWSMKWGTFTLYHGRLSNHGGPPAVRADRLDGSGHASATIREENYAYATDHGKTIKFWPTMIAFPDTGCWRITETHLGTTIHFTVRVAPQRASAGAGDR